MKALVLGGAGFIGSHMCSRLLNENYSVMALDNLSHGSISMIKRLKNNKNFSFIEVDVFDTVKMHEVFKKNKFDIVFHFASNAIAKIGENYMEHDVRELFETTIAILKVISNYDVKKFVYASSSTVYGCMNDVMRESSAHLRPISFYGAAKLASESFISAFSYSYNIQSYIIRMCNVVGKDCNHGIVYDIKQKITSGEKEIRLLGDGSQSKPFIHVDDVVDGILYVVSNSNEMYDIYQVGNENPITIKDIAKIVVEKLSPKSTIKFDVEKHTWHGDVEQYRFDNTKVKCMGWSPKLDSMESIIHSVE